MNDANAKFINYQIDFMINNHNIDGNINLIPLYARRFLAAWAKDLVMKEQMVTVYVL